MASSLDDRESLLVRVERKLAGRNIPRELLRETIDRVCALVDATDDRRVRGEIVVSFSCASMPDLASRLRSRLSVLGVAPTDSGTSTAGRHTVVVMRLDTSALGAVEDAAGAVGCNFQITDPNGASV